MDRETLISYALGALTPEQEERVVEHLKTHPDDAAFTRDVFESLADVATSRPASDLSAELLAGGETALLERIGAQPDKARREASPKARRVRWPVLGAVAIAIVVLVIQLAVPRPQERIEVMLQRTCAEEGVVCMPLLGEGGGDMGTIAMRPDTGPLLVMASEPPPGEAFQAWQIMSGEPTSLGVFSGRAMEVVGPLMPGASLGITIEPSGGSQQPTTTPVALMQL